MSTISDRIQDMLDEDPETTVEQAMLLLPEGTALNTVRSTLSRLKNKPKALTGEAALIAGITEFYTDGLVNLDEMMLMLRVVEARRVPALAMSAEQIKNSNTPEAQALAREAMRAA